MSASMARLARGVGRATELVMTRGAGARVETACGRTMLDFTCGIGVTNTGHCHPRVVEAAQAQCGKLIHGQVNVGWHEPMLELIEELTPLMPHQALDSFFFTTTGAEAVENAVKLAKHATGRPNVVVFQGGYHGRTHLTMGMTTSSNSYRKDFGPFPPGLLVAPFPYELHGVSIDYCLEQLELLLRQQTAASEVACMVLEPVLGEGGYVPAPPDFVAGLRRICDDNGILLVLDEVQTGFGRTGKLFASERFLPGAAPDILIMAKGLASGFPLAAIAASKSLTEKQPPGSMGGTYAGNAVSCAAAVATQRVVCEERLVENAARQGEVLKAALDGLAQRHGAGVVRDVRGHGLMLGLELAKDVPAGTAKRVVQACVSRGLLLLNCSVYETLRFIPPLTVTEQEVAEAVEIFDAALAEAVPPA